MDEPLANQFWWSILLMAVCGCLLYQLVHDFLIFSPSAESSNCELVMLVLYLPTKTYFNNVEGIVGACFPSTFQGPCPSLCRLGISPSYTTEAFFGFEIVGQHFSRNVMKSAPFQWCVWACSLILVSHLSDSNKHREHCVFASPAVHVQVVFFHHTRITSRRHFFTVTQWGWYSSSHYGLGWPYLESASLSEGSCRCVSQSLQGRGIKGSINIRTSLYLL